jgi:hypothetical protein
MSTSSRRDCTRPSLAACAVLACVGACAVHPAALDAGTEASFADQTAPAPAAPPTAGAPELTAPSAPPTVVDAALELITREHLEQHVRYLASDELAGRPTGSDGALLAARYLADALAEAGVAPAGDDGSYFQRVPLSTLDFQGVPRIVATTVQGGELAFEYGTHFSQWSGAPPGQPLTVHVVRSSLDMPHEPRPDLALYVDGSRKERSEWIESDEDWGAILRPGSQSDGETAETTPRSVRTVGNAPPAGPRFVVRGALRDALERGLLRELRIEADTTRTNLPAFNVVGRLPGRGDLARETIVYSAHYDHIGVRTDPDATPDDDLVYNGADDDASGCAAVLELARALAADARRAEARAADADGAPPARTQLFLLVTGEEIGLVGTRYYLDHPIEPLEGTVCNLNFEMIGRPDDTVGGAGNLWLTGFERSNLGAAFRAAGLALRPDQRPEEKFFQRSDNYAFALRGIVAQTLSSYDLHADYHQVTDEADSLDYAHMEACTRASLGAARALASGAISPAWEPGGRPEGP